MVNVRKSSDRVRFRQFNIEHSTFPIPLHSSRFSRKSRESRTNNANWLFEPKENRLKNHRPQGKLPPEPIATTIHSPQPYPDVRRVLPSGEVREWPNRAVSKTAVLATGPWVRSPPSPPNQACSCRRRPGRVCLVHLVCLVGLVYSVCSVCLVCLVERN